ncbi:MAG TPA: tRNA (N(6)-L-threonylcarbamoyladenosine(37)-C(2))-methylthiotransferase MtaB [Kofleriaceae bacterium]|nr:tRNA (N(6)-L-threonylcarbamoyladenosine(37)-C(2))-methylthiotransferase MtaB [Kofleriaceae bacterium]
MQVFLTTLGCRLNEAELEGWARELRAGGHRVVGTPVEAQVMVVNTCAVTGEAARKSRKFIGGLHRQNPRAPLVVTGCMSELEPDKAAALAGVDLVVGNGDKERLVTLLETAIDPSAMPAMAAEPEGSHVYAHHGRTRAFVKVQDGCRNRCTFCIVTVARGEERSRAIDELIEEVNALHEAGYQEVVLCGVHLGGYGSDLGTDLRALVAAVLARTCIPRVRLSSLEPWDLPEGFFELWQDPRLMPHLHLPLQSGSDAVLKRMARRCSTGEYARLVDAARAAIPDLTLTSDVIVGFPGETEDEWRATVDFVRQIGFAHLHIFTFSPREGTRAARLAGQLRGDLKRARSRELHALAAEMKAAHLAGYRGQTRPVLWEGIGQPGPAGRLAWSGYTDNYLRVRTDVAAGTELENVIAPALLAAVEGEFLTATVI